MPELISPQGTRVVVPDGQVGALQRFGWSKPAVKPAAKPAPKRKSTAKSE